MAEETTERQPSQLELPKNAYDLARPRSGLFPRFADPLGLLRDMYSPPPEDSETTET